VSEQARHCVDKQYSAFVVWKNMVVFFPERASDTTFFEYLCFTVAIGRKLEGLMQDHAIRGKAPGA
jgi:hypothetical protein